jgi:hypothetical protein
MKTESNTRKLCIEIIFEVNENELQSMIVYLIYVPIWGKLYHNLQFFHLNIYRVIVLAKEYLQPNIMLNYENTPCDMIDAQHKQQIQNFTLISWASIVGLFWTIKLMFLKATYWISGSADKRVTSGGAIFLQRFRTTSVLVMSSICRRII